MQTKTVALHKRKQWMENKDKEQSMNENCTGTIYARPKVFGLSSSNYEAANTISIY